MCAHAGSVAGPTAANARRVTGSAGHALWFLVRRLAMVGLLLGLLSLAPWGGPLGPVRWKHAVMTLLAVAGIGKALYDTLFFDRFRS